jgi:hypothetical protein
MRYCLFEIQNINIELNKTMIIITNNNDDYSL